METMSEQMDKNVVCASNGISLSHKNKRSTDTRSMWMNLKKHYAKWKKPDKKGHIILWFHLYEKSRLGKPRATKHSMVVASSGAWEASSQGTRALSLGWWEPLSQTEAVAVQRCQCTKCYPAVHFQVVHYVNVPAARNAFINWYNCNYLHCEQLSMHLK